MLLTFGANAAQLTACAPMQRGNNSRLRRCTAQAPSFSPMWSSDEAAGSSCNSVPMSERPWHIKPLSFVNESTKWTVSATVLAVLLWQHNEYAAWCVVGAVLSSVLCKVLKHVLNHQRPDGAPKADPGMPSSHANSLNFLSVYAALSLAYHTHNSPGALVLAAAAVGLGMFKTWLRVFLGFHTWPQVLVGAALGASTAVTWFKLGTAWALPSLQRSPTGLAVLYSLTVLGSAAFGAKIISGWWKDHKQKQQQERGGRLPGANADGNGENMQLLTQPATEASDSLQDARIGSDVLGTGRSHVPSAVGTGTPSFAT